MTGSFMGRGQYIPSRFCTVNCRPWVRNYHLSHIGSGVCKCRPQRWETSVLPLHHHDRHTTCEGERLFPKFLKRSPVCKTLSKLCQRSKRMSYPNWNANDGIPPKNIDFNTISNVIR